MYRHFSEILYPLIVDANYDCWLTLAEIFSAKKLDSLTHKLLLFHALITHINDNHIKFEVTLHFWRIWPTVRRSSRALLFFPRAFDYMYALLGAVQTGTQCVHLKNYISYRCQNNSKVFLNFSTCIG